MAERIKPISKKMVTQIYHELMMDGDSRKHRIMGNMTGEGVPEPFPAQRATTSTRATGIVTQHRERMFGFDGGAD